MKTSVYYAYVELCLREDVYFQVTFLYPMYQAVSSLFLPLLKLVFIDLLLKSHYLSTAYLKRNYQFFHDLKLVPVKPRWLLLKVTWGCIQTANLALPQLPIFILYQRFSAQERKWGGSPSGLQLFRLCHSSLPILCVLAAYSCLGPHATFAVLQWQLNCHETNLV